MRTHPTPWICLNLVLVHFTPRPSSAQELPEPHDVRRTWIAAGLGAGSGSGLGLSADLAHQIGPHLLSIRGSAVGEVCFEYCDPGTNYSDIAVLYGRSTRNEWIHASLSVGPGVASMVQRQGDFESLDESTPGLAGQAEISLHLAVVGVGLIGFANVNTVDSFMGFTVSLKAGWLR